MEKLHFAYQVHSIANSWAALDSQNIDRFFLWKYTFYEPLSLENIKTKKCYYKLQKYNGTNYQRLHSDEALKSPMMHKIITLQ